MNTEQLNPRLDGDTGWIGEDSTRHPSQLRPGQASRMENQLALNGELRPRPGVSRPDWGCPLWDYVTMSFGYSVTNGLPTLTLTGANAVTANVQDIVVGQTLTGTGIPGATTISTVNLGALTLTMSANATGTNSGTITLTLLRATFAPGQVNWIDALRYADTTGTDSLTVLIQGQRSDGGNGRCFRIIAGSLAKEISLNGYDLWDGARLVECGTNGILLLRPGRRRYYVKFADVNLATDQVTFHVTPSWIAGSRVIYNVAGAGSIDPLVNGTSYWVSVAGAAVRFHASKADALAGINVINLTAVSATGWWYFELDEPDVLPETNWGEPLILQGSTTLEMWDVGLALVPSQLSITDAVVATDVWVIPNHRFVDGDEIKFRSFTGIVAAPIVPGAADKGWAEVISEHSIRVYTDQEGALERDAAKLVNITVTGTGVCKKSGASDLPIPPARLGLYHKGRVILVRGNDRLLVSDSNDPIHYAPLVSETRIEEGQGKQIIALSPYLNDSMLVFKRDEVHQIDNISGDITDWSVNTITKKYGCVAERGPVTVGNDVWFPSYQGIASIRQTEQGETLGVAQPVSEAIAARIAEIDWSEAGNIQGSTWNNLVFFAVPLTGQTAPVRNTSVLVWSTINQAWQGRWMADTLKPIQWVPYNLSGKEVLCWLDPTGWIRYFREEKLVDNRTDGYDTEDAISQSVTTRGYSPSPAGTQTVMQGIHLGIATWNPSLDVSVIPDGVNEDRSLLPAEWTRNRVKYTNYGQADYDATNVNDDWERRYRQDYSVPLNVYLGANGVRFGQHQDCPLKLPVNRAAGRPVQFRITASRGSMQLRSLTCVGTVGRVNGREDT